MRYVEAGTTYLHIANYDLGDAGSRARRMARSVSELQRGPLGAGRFDDSNPQGQRHQHERDGDACGGVDGKSVRAGGFWVGQRRRQLRCFFTHDIDEAGLPARVALVPHAVVVLAVGGMRDAGPRPAWQPHQWRIVLFVVTDVIAAAPHARKRRMEVSMLARDLALLADAAEGARVAICALAMMTTETRLGVAFAAPDGQWMVGRWWWWWPCALLLALT